MSSPTIPSRLHAMRTPAYLVFATVALMPLLDFGGNILPLSPHSVLWRFGVGGLIASAFSLPLLMILLAYVLAHSTDHRPMVTTIAGLGAALGLFMLLTAGAFSLDALQMKGNVKPEAVSKFFLASALATIKLLIQSAAFFAISASAVRSRRARRRDLPRDAIMLPPIAAPRTPAMPALAD